MNKQDLPWIEKHRPKSLNDISGQDEIIKLLKKCVEQKNIQHMLFYGLQGTGKTSTIHSLAYELYGPLYKQRVLEMNASDERGIAVVRDKISTFAAGIVSGDVTFKLVILDEADSMTSEAQSALKRIIEKFTNITRFCLICNDVSKIDSSLISRCAVFRFKPLPDDVLKSRLDYICKKESIKVSNEAKKEVFKIARGDLRSSITLLQSASQLSSDEIVSAESVIKISGMLPRELIDSLWNSWNTGKFTNVQKIITTIIHEGYSASVLISQLYQQILREDDDDYDDNKLKHNEQQRMDMFIVLAEADKSLIDGANEELQLLNVAVKFLRILNTN